MQYSGEGVAVHVWYTATIIVAAPVRSNDNERMVKIEAFLDCHHVLIGAKDELDSFRLTMDGQYEMFDGFQCKYRHIRSKVHLRSEW